MRHMILQLAHFDLGQICYERIRLKSALKIN